jgi:hypothetical protein
LMVIGYAMFTILFFIFELTINMRKFLPKLWWQLHHTWNRGFALRIHISYVLLF